jgi:hypothetical protein
LAQKSEILGRNFGGKKVAIRPEDNLRWQTNGDNAKT